MGSVQRAFVLVLGLSVHDMDTGQVTSGASLLWNSSVRFRTYQKPSSDPAGSNPRPPASTFLPEVTIPQELTLHKPAKGVVVKIMVPFWSLLNPIIIRHRIFCVPKRDHFDNHPYAGISPKSRKVHQRLAHADAFHHQHGWVPHLKLL